MTRKPGNACALLVAALFLLLGASKGELLADEERRSEPKESRASQQPRTVEVGAELTSVTISRIKRTPTALASRASALAGAITQSNCSSSQAATWAREALLERGKITSAKPFSCSSDIEVTYLGYYV
jgi:hypothetical protein